VLGVAAGALQGADGSLSPAFGRRVDHLAHFRDLGCREAALLGPRPKRMPRDDTNQARPNISSSRCGGALFVTRRSILAHITTH
jgi:hypothetical protein